MVSSSLCVVILPVRLLLEAHRHWVRIPGGSDICPNCSKAWSVQCVYCTVHCEEPLKSFEVRIGHIPGFGLPSVAILPWLYRKRRKAIFTHSHECQWLAHCVLWFCSEPDHKNQKIHLPLKWERGKRVTGRYQCILFPNIHAWSAHHTPVDLTFSVRGSPLYVRTVRG